MAAGRRPPPVAGIPRRAAGRRHRPLPGRDRTAQRGDHPPPGRRRPRPVAGRPHRRWTPPWPRPSRWPPTMSCWRTCWPAWPRSPARPDLLLGVSVYREPVDTQRGAVRGRAARPRRRAHPGPGSRLPSRSPPSWPPPGSPWMSPSTWPAVPGPVREQLAPHLAELNRPPTPPFRPPPGLDEQIAACQAASLLTVTGEDGAAAVFRAPVDRHRAGRAGRPRARPAAGRGAPAGGRLLAVAGPGVAAGPGR